MRRPVPGASCPVRENLTSCDFGSALRASPVTSERSPATGRAPRRWNTSWTFQVRSLLPSRLRTPYDGVSTLY